MHVSNDHPDDHDTSRVNDANMLDRLVDGELTDAEERAVIAKLDDTRDGWRRCALAFLEARCWQRTMTQLRDVSKVEPTRSPSPSGHAPFTHPPANLNGFHDRQRLRGWATSLALCVLFLLAFAGGSLLPDWWSPSMPNTPSMPSTAGRPAEPTQWANGERPAGHDDSQSKPSDAADPHDESGRPNHALVGNLPLMDNAGRRVVIPVYEWNKQVSEQPKDRSPPLPPEFLPELKRHQVHSQQSYLPVKLEDGRHVVVPVQQLEIIPVGGMAF